MPIFEASGHCGGAAFGRPEGEIPICAREQPSRPLAEAGLTDMPFGRVTTALRSGGVASSSSVQDYDFKERARDVARRAAAEPGVHVGVFYDPMESAWREQAPSAQALRKQVRDFVGWLRDKGLLDRPR